MSLLTGHAFPRHAHDQFGIGIFVQGSQRSWSNIGSVESAAGDVIMVNPAEIHDGLPLQGPRGWHMMYLNPEMVMGELREQPQTDNIIMRPVVSDAALGCAMRALFNEVLAATPDPIAAEQALLLCLMRITRYHAFTAAVREPLSPAITLAKEYIDDAPGNAISLSMLADLCGMTRFQLIRSFTREAGTTPHAYLIQARVRLAKRLLLAGHKPAGAALSAGFADQSHLTRAFRRQFGLTPGKYLHAML
ncbi:helix-turn-helix transcriptional regulator [Izhakiella australiensis]|nr:AraC family transcriptional regulator [Izhakiella australiensis]